MTGCLDVRPDDPMVARFGLGAVAARYQRLGFAVLGLGVGSKSPHRLMRAGVHWADTDHRLIPWMWGQEKMAGIGIACGQPSGIVVVDLDRHGEQDGRLVWQRFLAWNNRTIEPGPWVQTPNGGEHHYYRLPPGVTVPKRPGLLPGVDIQAQSSYVAAPPSRVIIDTMARGGERAASVMVPYIWHGCPCTLPMVPRWLLEAIMTMPGTGNGGGGDPSEDLPELADLYENGLPVGLRNVGLMRLACQQFRRFKAADPDGAAREAIDKVLARTIKTGFSHTEQERTIASARAFVARQEAADMDAWEDRYGRR